MSVPSRRVRRLVLVLLGIVAGQAVLYGPSLVGQKILLPLDLLAQPRVYLPSTPEVVKIEPHDRVRSDLVYMLEPARRFAVAELRAGRFPWWTPHQYAGAPFVWPKYSPFNLVQYMTPSPVIVAWAQLFAALVAGLGANLFCRRVLGVSFWAAAIAAWCYPLTGFFVLWQGYSTCAAAFWLPWLLLAVDRAVRRPRLVAAAALSAVTGLVLISGHADVAAQVLLASGLYALWCLFDAHRRAWRAARRGVLVLVAGWSLGFMLAAPHLLPMMEYLQTSARMQKRSAGREERPPIGWAALPEAVLPDYYGTSRTGSLRIAAGNQIESAAASYAGLLALLLAAPLAFCSPRHRSSNLLWAGLALFGLSWCLNVPGLVSLLRLPGLKILSHNRLTLITAFAIPVLAAVGLDVLGQGLVRRRWWFWLPAGLLAGIGALCLWRAAHPPEPVATQLAAAVAQGRQFPGIAGVEGVRDVQEWFAASSLQAAFLCALGLVGWLFLWTQKAPRVWLVPALGSVLVCDLLFFASGRSAQADPALYYPRIPALEAVARAPAGRMLCYSCLPASLSQTYGLRDLRGYDGVDPARLMELMALARDPHATPFSYALTQWFVPRARPRPPAGIDLPPVLDLLGVRYVVFRGPAPEGVEPAFTSPDYWVLENQSALPRVFVPQRVELVAGDGERLAKMGADGFDPRAVAYVEAPVDLPSPARGTAQLVDEIPTRITVSLRMETPGLVVLTDRWDAGWHAYLDGRTVPIVRADHALRGVVVPAGAATLQFRYQPASLARGLRLAAAAALVLLGGLALATRPGRKTQAPS